MDKTSGRDLFASSLRLAVHQTLSLSLDGKGWQRGRIGGELLYSSGPGSAVANAIREGNTSAGLQQVLSTQTSILRNKSSLAINQLLHELDSSSAKKS
jgi:hypothetical protein